MPARPIVRTYRAERNQNVIVLLDNGRVMAGRVDGVPRVEHAMDAVLFITTVATRLGDQVGLVAFDREVRAVVPPSHHSSQVSQVSEAMYDLEPQLAESDYRGAFAESRLPGSAGARCSSSSPISSSSRSASRCSRRCR